jgi:hypothetical protein
MFRFLFKTIKAAIVCVLLLLVAAAIMSTEGTHLDSTPPAAVAGTQAALPASRPIVRTFSIPSPVSVPQPTAAGVHGALNPSEAKKDQIARLLERRKNVVKAKVDRKEAYAAEMFRQQRIVEEANRPKAKAAIIVIAG